MMCPSGYRQGAYSRILKYGMRIFRTVRLVGVSGWGVVGAVPRLCPKNLAHKFRGQKREFMSEIFLGKAGVLRRLNPSIRGTHLRTGLNGG